MSLIYYRMPVKNPNSEIIKVIEAKFCPTYNRIIYVTYAFKIIFISLIIISLHNINKLNCKCDNINDKIYIKEWFIFVLIFNIIFIIIFIFSDKVCYYYMTKENLPYIIVSLISFISLIMLIRLINYLNILRKDCPCGYGKLEKILFWYLITILSIIALFIIFTIIIIIFGIIKLYNNN